jgi:hypothetical protein
MSFTVPNTFTTGVVNASALKENMDEARTYINADVDGADYITAAFSTQDLQEGEFFGVTQDAIFMTGDQYLSFSATYKSHIQERHYHTSTIKRQHPMTSTRYVSVPQLAKQFYMEAPGNALVEISFFAFEDENNDCRGAIYPWTTSTGSRSSGQDSRYVLALDGATIEGDKTRAYAFSENGATTVTFGQHSIMEGESGYQGGVAGMRRFITMQYLAKNLTQGWHTIQVLVDPCNESGFVSSHTFCVELFYDMGYHEVSKNSIGTTRKLPEVVY